MTGYRIFELFALFELLTQFVVVVVAVVVSHFDGIRALVFHPVEPVLITAAEDNMLKLWNLQKTVPAKKYDHSSMEFF